MQNNNLSIIPDLITVDIGKWIMENAGKVAIAKILPDRQKALIIAIENGDVATPYMVKYAKENDAIKLIGISECEKNAID